MSDQYGTEGRDPHPSQWPQYGGPQSQYGPEGGGEPQYVPQPYVPQPYVPQHYGPAPGRPPGRPPYEPPGWTALPYPSATPGPPPLTPRRRRVHPAVWIVSAVLAAAVVAGLLVVLLAKDEVDDAPGTDGRRLAVPASVPGYTQPSGINTDDLLADMGDQLAKYAGDDPDKVVEHAAIGVFERGGNRIVFVGIALEDTPAFKAQSREDGIESTLKSFLSGVDESAQGSSGTESFDPGPRGGFLRCGDTTIAGAGSAYCGWADQSALSLTIIGKSTSLADSAQITRTLRLAIESG